MVNAVADSPRLEWVVTRNEANASLMAAAHAKLTGQLGVVIATSGPGATNLTTGLFDAMQDQVPVIAITGLKPRAGMHYSEFQDFNQAQLFAAGGLQFSVDVAAPEAVPALLRDAVAKAITLRTCVHLAIPVDIQAAPSPLPLKYFCAADARKGLVFPDVRQEVIDSVAEELFGKVNVVIAVGQRCVSAGPKILELAEKLHSPVLTRLDAKGSVDESHPLAMGVIGVHGKPGMEVAAQLLQTAHLVLSFGNHDDTLLICNNAGLQIRPIIHFEPDASASLLNMRFKALHHVIGDPAWACDALIKKLNDMENSTPNSQPRLDRRTRTKTFLQDTQKMREVTQSDVCEKIQSHAEELWQWFQDGEYKKLTKEQVRNRFEVMERTKYTGCHPACVLDQMSTHMGDSDTLCVDVGDVTLWGGLCAHLTKGQRTLSTERMGTMGYGLCAGIATVLEKKENSRAVVIAGDGAFQMSCNELGTLKQQLALEPNKDISVVCIVFDNEVLGRVEFGFAGAKGCHLGPSPDFVALSKAYGGDGALLKDPADIPKVMDAAFTSKGLYVVHVLVDTAIHADMATVKDNSIKMMASG